MIAAIQFRNFKALRSAAIRLEQFNLVLGPSGSGKTSLIEALLRLRALAGGSVAHAHDLSGLRPDGPRMEFLFQPPFEAVKVSLACRGTGPACDTLVVEHPPGPDGEKLWTNLRVRIESIRAHLFDHYAMAVPVPRNESAGLSSNAGNLAAVLAAWQTGQPAAFRELEAEFVRIMPEFAGLELRPAGEGGGLVELCARLVNGNGGEIVAAEGLSQGVLYLLATLTLAFDPVPPAVVCLEEADRGVHPRLLREVRDALYRLSYPRDFGLERGPVQVVATTHSPYLLDQFRDHPGEIVLGHKRGRAATFERLSERTDLVELLREASLGDLWYSGILGGVPGEE